MAAATQHCETYIAVYVGDIVVYAGAQHCKIVKDLTFLGQDSAKFRRDIIILQYYYSLPLLRSILSISVLKFSHGEFGMTWIVAGMHTQHIPHRTNRCYSESRRLKAVVTALLAAGSELWPAFQVNFQHTFQDVKARTSRRYRLYHTHCHLAKFGLSAT